MPELDPPPETPSNTIEQVTRFLEKRFPYPLRQIPPEKAHLPLESQLCHLLTGTTDQRQPGRVSSAAKEHLTTIVHTSTKNGEPIPLYVGPIGTIKWTHLGENPEHHEPDLSELAALMNILSIAQSVDRVYPHGTTITINFEDLTGLGIIPGGPDYVNQSQTHYRQKLLEQIDFACDLAGFDRHRIKLIDESSLGPGNPETTKTLHAAEVTRLTPIFATYLHESQLADPESLSSYHDLRQEGWQGTIPPAMRLDRAKKIAKYQPDLTPSEVEQQMANFYANALARVRLGLRYSHPSINYTFITPSPGDPPNDKIYLHPHLFNNNTPPWIANTCIKLSRRENGSVFTRFKITSRSSPKPTPTETATATEITLKSPHLKISIPTTILQ